MLALSVLPFALVGTVALATSTTWRLLRQSRARRMLGRLAPETPAEGLPARVGAPVVLRGQVLGGSIVTAFEGRARTIEDAHVRAQTVTRPDVLTLRVGAHNVAVEGPVQVILGAKECDEVHLDERRSVRAVDVGDEVLAEGALREEPNQAGSEGYRDHATAFTLVPARDDAWPMRPVAIYASRTPRVRVWPAALAMVLTCVLGFVAWPRYVRGTTRATGPAPIASAAPRPPCASEVTRRLDAGDPWSAAALSCRDARARAEVAWTLGRVDDAARGFAEDRAAHPDEPLTTTEVEAAMMHSPATASPLVGALRQQWYKGPRDDAQSAMECIVEVLASRSVGPRRFSDYCGPLATRGYSQSHTNIHNLPAYALHDPAGYPLLQPLAGQDRRYGVGCGSSFTRLEGPTELACRANLDVMRAMFAAVIGDTPRLAAELGKVRELTDALDALGGTEDLTLSYPMERVTRQELSKSYREELGSLHMVAHQIAAVAAAAAWVGHDASALSYFSSHSVGHEGAILREHLELVAGTRTSPHPAHSPSDYSVLDMEMFAFAETATPTDLVKRLREKRFTSPTRVAALLSARPAAREAARAWVRGDYALACRTCGVHALLRASYARREAARLVGDEELEGRLREVTRSLGEALLRAESFAAVTSLESLLDR